MLDKARLKAELFSKQDCRRFPAGGHHRDGLPRGRGLHPQLHPAVHPADPPRGVHPQPVHRPPPRRGADPQREDHLPRPAVEPGIYRHLSPVQEGPGLFGTGDRQEARGPGKRPHPLFHRGKHAPSWRRPASPRSPPFSSGSISPPSSPSNPPDPPSAMNYLPFLPPTARLDELTTLHEETAALGQPGEKRLSPLPQTALSSCRA